MNSVKTQMTSKRGVLCELLEYTRTAKWNIFVLSTVLTSAVHHRTRNAFTNLSTACTRSPNKLNPAICLSQWRLLLRVHVDLDFGSSRSTRE